MRTRFLVGAGILAAVIALGVAIYPWQRQPVLSEAEMAARMDDAEEAFARTDYAEVAEILAELADAGLPLAQYRLGLMYREGRGVELDLDRAVALLEDAAAQDWSAAADALVAVYLERAEAASSPADEIVWLERAARRGDAGAMAVMGSYYFSGTGVERDVERGIRLLTEAAEAGDVRAQSNLGYAYSTGTGVARDDARALQWYRMSAEAGMIRAQAAVGLFYETGRGTDPDITEAVRWYLNIVGDGVPGISARLGALVASGAISAENYPDAQLWVLDAARAGDSASLRWLEERAEADDAAALNALAIMYEAGEGVPQHDGRALEYFRRAADAGSPSSQLAMARRFAAGQGVTQDYLQAHVWANLAAARGATEAARERDVFARFLTPEQLAEAQELAAEWQPSQ